MTKTINLDLAPEYWKQLGIIGVGRDAEYPKTLCLYMSREYSDDELRRLHEAFAGAAAQMDEERLLPTPHRKVK